MKAFKTSYYGVEISDDIIGAEITSALKNVYSIAISWIRGYESKFGVELSNAKGVLATMAIREIGVFVEGALFLESRNGENRLLHFSVTYGNSVLCREIFDQSLIDERLKSLLFQAELLGGGFVQCPSECTVVLLIYVAVGILKLCHRDRYIAYESDTVAFASVLVGSPTYETGTDESYGADPDSYNKIFSVLLHPGYHSKAFGGFWI